MNQADSAMNQVRWSGWLPQASWQRLLVLEGHSKIAQQFTAVWTERRNRRRPAGTVERTPRRGFNRPYGTNYCMPVADPAMNRWAIVERPSGSSAHSTCQRPRGVLETQNMIHRRHGYNISPFRGRHSHNDVVPAFFISCLA